MRTRKPPRSREQYILDSVETLFKGGGWIEVPISRNDPVIPTNPVFHLEGGEGVSGRQENGSGVPAQDSTSTRYMTIIGGKKIDEDLLYGFLSDREQAELVVGEGRGVETAIARNYPYTTVVQVDPDRYGKNARKVNVEQVLCFAPNSPLLLVGSGERVKQAKSWLERTLSKREVIELP